MADEIDDIAGQDARRIGQTAHRILGVFRKTAEGGRIVPIDKGAEREWTVAPGATLSARDGELVEAELAGPKVRMGLPGKCGVINTCMNSFKSRIEADPYA